MRLFRRRPDPAPPEEPRESAQALADSQEKLQREREHLVIPLRRLIDQNNVTPLVRDLIRKKGGMGDYRAPAG